MAISCLRKDAPTSPFSESQLADARKGGSIPTLEEIITNRLRITRLGLADLRKLIESGMLEEAELICEKIDEDCAMLQRRLRPLGSPSRS